MEQLILIVVLLAVYAAVLIPQRRKRLAQKALLDGLEEGDLVITTAGIYGEVTELDGDSIFVEVAPRIELRMTRNSVAHRIIDADEV